MHDLNLTNRWTVAAASALALGMTFIDQTALNTALPTIGRQLHLSSCGLHWIINAYLLALTVFLILGGKLGDRLGKKILFLAGVSLFGLASLGSAIAPTGFWLIVSRVMQGLGGALMLPNSTAITLSIFPDDMRGKVMGTLLSFTSIFLIFGPFLGGFLTQYASWRYVFVLNIPLSLASIVLMLYYGPHFPPNKTKLIDWFGFILLAITLFLFVFGFMQGSNQNGLLTIVVSFILGALFFIAFLWHESHHEMPFVELTLFKNGAFNRATFIYSGTQMVFMINVFIAIYIQTVLGYSPMVAGIFSILSLSPVMLLSRFAGRLRDQHGPRLPMQLGLLSLILGTVWLTCTFWTYNIFLIFPGTFGFSMAAPFIFGNAMTTAVTAVEPRFRSLVAGITSCCRQLGATLSMAILSMIMSYAYHNPSATLQAAHHTYMLALTVAALVTLAIAIICYSVSIKLPIKKT
jgi:EmrB/QacA subfamily drug resistance transporter